MWQSILLAILGRLDVVPQPLLDVTDPVMKARIIISATQLGVFDALASGPLSYDRIAQTIQAKGDTLQLILDALEGFGYIKAKNGRYQNTRTARKYLVSTSPTSLSNMVLFQEDAAFMATSLTELTRTGLLPTSYQTYLAQKPDRWRFYVLGMRDGARMSVSQVLAHVPVPTQARRLLDLGGSHGLYASSFCQRYPQLQATVFDQPEAIAIGQEVAVEMAVQDRVTYQPGDFWQHSLGEGYDIVLLFSILHLFSPSQNQQLLHRLAQAMVPGGTLVVADFLADRLAKGWSASFSLGMRCFFGKGKTYKQTTIRQWLDEAGFRIQKVRHLRNPASLIIATKSTA